MSDHDAPHDPMDKAYAQAEAVLSDEAARAARRARVLAAVAQAAPDAATPRSRPAAWRRGGWLAAASVAGLSLLVAIQIRPPVATESPAAPSAPSAPAVTADEAPKAPPAAKEPPETRIYSPQRSAAAPDAAAPAGKVARVEEAPAPPPPPPPPPPRQIARARPEAPLAAAPAAPPADEGLSELVVTASRIPSARQAPRAASAVGAQSGLAGKLRDAAAGGRAAEVTALLARGVPVDAPDDDGETALMKSIRAKQPAAAALLRSHGASLDWKNEAGETARDLARSIGDAELNRALGLDG